jgi:hypothetical protein
LESAQWIARLVAVSGPLVTRVGPDVAAPDEVPTREVVPLLILVTIVATTSVLHGFYAGIARPLPDAAPILEQVACWLAIWAWFAPYAARHRMTLVMDLGMWFFGLWVFLVPYFLFKTQRWKALIPIGAYVLLVLVSNVVAGGVRILVSR